MPSNQRASNWGMKKKDVINWDAHSTMEDNMGKALDWRWENVRTLVNQCR